MPLFSLVWASRIGLSHCCAAMAPAAVLAVFTNSRRSMVGVSSSGSAFSDDGGECAVRDSLGFVGQCSGSCETTTMLMRRRTFLAGVAAAAASGMLRARASGSMAFDAASPSALSHDPRRPQYHLLPAANWMNDPNGPVYWRGEYHMFYQYNPHAAIWGDMHWGHAHSPDMVHWRHMPVALAPTPGGPDAGGCFSGTALADGDRVAVVYTGVVPARESEATIRDGVHSLRESQCLAFATGNDLTACTKDPVPVIAAPPPGLDVTGFRDPAPWRDGDTWYMAVGSGIRGKGGAVLLYRSKDLRHWEYLHLLAEGSANGQQAAN